MKKQEKKEDWIQKKWRPMMAIMYMIVCIFDFILFPIMFTIVQFWETEAANDAFRQWQPLTLVGAGLFHMAMGAVLGITAWSRGQEKIAGVSVNSQHSPTTPVSWQGSQSSANYREVNYETIAPVAIGYKGKKAPVEPEHPLI